MVIFINRKPEEMLNSTNKLTTFLPSEFENPRLNILQNFKEINRIMTGSYLKNKEIEERYRNSTMPEDELQKKL